MVLYFLFFSKFCQKKAWATGVELSVVLPSFHLKRWTKTYLRLLTLVLQTRLNLEIFVVCVVLQLCCNQLTGNIPKQMGSLKRLSVLALQSNRLMGDIPASLGNLRMLRRLYLSCNSFSGGVPAILADIPQLEALDVRNNSLSGVVPSGMSISTILQYFLLHRPLKKKKNSF